MATERIRLLTISCPRESPAESWAQLGVRWDRLSKRLGRRMKRAGRQWQYFGTVELQKRGNPHLHVLMRDTGFIPKAEVHALGYECGFGFSDIRQIQPGAGVQYVTKYLHKSAGQELPRGARRIRRSQRWDPRPPAIVSSWGPSWDWSVGEGNDPEWLAGRLERAGYTVLRYEQQITPTEGD